MFKKGSKKKTTKVLDDFSSEEDSINQEKEQQQSYQGQKKKKMAQEFSTSQQKDTSKKQTEEMADSLYFKGTVQILSTGKDNAIYQNEIDTDHDRDPYALAMKNMKISKELKDGKLDKKFYRGDAAYELYAEKSEKDIMNSKWTGSLGPIRAPTNIRVTCNFDYNPSLCKDYHDTGYCVFGNSCIYIHDRGDYKSGWELERDWLREQKMGGHSSSEDEDEEQLKELEVPETCPICQRIFIDPIQTSCSHFFCSKCALKHYSQSKDCFVCKKPVNGIFNNAIQVIKKMNETKNDLKKKVKMKRILKGKKQLDDDDVDDNEEEAQNFSIENQKQILNEGELISGVLIGDSKKEIELSSLTKEINKNILSQRSKFKRIADWSLQ